MKCLKGGLGPFRGQVAARSTYSTIVRKRVPLNRLVPIQSSPHSVVYLAMLRLHSYLLHLAGNASCSSFTSVRRPDLKFLQIATMTV
jgi:hypothetical protein